MAESKTGPRNEGRGTYTLELVGLEPGAARPPVVVQAVDAGGGVLHSETVSDSGGFSLPPDVLKKARYVVLGAPGDDNKIAAATSMRFRPGEFEAAASSGTLALAEGIWSRLRFFWHCVSGSVRVCRRRPRWFDDIFTAVAGSVTARLSARTFQASTRARAFTVADALSPSISDVLAWPTRCYPVCLGTVTVFRRSCCCFPLVVDDPRIEVLIRDLGRLVERLPKLPPGKFPPPPPPDPFATVLFKGGGLNELALNAATDLRALRSLSGDQAAQYVNSRVYLLRQICLCGRPERVASGALMPDGSFNICWLEALRLQQINCHEEFAYIVTQTIGGTTTTIYDGIAAGAWYHASDHPVLTTYRQDAFNCNETGTGDGTAAVFLDQIGTTDSHELTTPDAAGWDRVAAPTAQAGLLFPVDTGNGLLRNLGGGIELTFSFPEAMKHPSVDAKYYRVSVTKADGSGNPVGDRYYYGSGLNNGNDGLTWQKVAGSDLEPVVLGPNPPVAVGGENYLYTIPYDSDETWVGEVRYHALINTHNPLIAGPGDDEGLVGVDAENHLVTLELFNPAGERIRPLGVPASGQPTGVEVAKPFKFKRWFQPEGTPGDDLKDVPFAALTHLFCWDNRTPRATITRLVLGETASNDECQFLKAHGDDEFGIEYRAYVPDERFQYAHSIGWIRGLGGSALNGGVGTLGTPQSPDNVGEPPDAPGLSEKNTFELMLTRIDGSGPLEVTTILERCAFAVTLTTQSKTTDGGSVSYPQVQDQAAFALEIEPEP